MSDFRLSNLSLSVDYSLFSTKLINTKNLLIIQDLDGVCMGLVKNPLNRVIDYDYVKATQKLAGHFFVLTNGEHIGTFGVNGIIDKSASKAGIEQPSYLPGLAAGGVQWQDNNGNVNYPGVSDTELAFLKQIPDFFQQKLTEFCEQEVPFLGFQNPCKGKKNH